MSKLYPVKVTPGGTIYLGMPEHLTLLEDFMIVDLNEDNIQKYIAIINKALELGEEGIISGNTTTLSIKKEKTEVYNSSIDIECTIDTVELKEIIKIYLKESLVNNIIINIKRMQSALERAQNVESISEILEIKQNLNRKDII